MFLSPSSKIFSGLPVRQLLTEISYRASNLDEQISLGLVFETNAETLEARAKSHLTNSTQSDHQIRFPLQDRVARSIQKLATGVQAHLPSHLDIQVQLADDDFVSVEFFKNLKQASVTRVKGPLPAGDSSLLTSEEKKILVWLDNPEASFPDLIKKCRERIYSSDYRTAYEILSRLPDDLKNDDVHYMLGLCTNFFGRFLESETHFQVGLLSRSAYSRVRAAYVISMLYLRMHEKEKQNLEMAEGLLEIAFETLQQHPEIPDWTFNQVFNRNGFALCLYRRGKVEQALALLESGIKTLDDQQQGASRLHQSVLIYNAVQCLRELRRYDECERKCEELLKIDPSFPEYYLEQSRTFLDQNKTAQALRSIELGVALDSFIPEAFALQGYAFLQRDDYASAANSYRQAINLKPDDAQLKQDLEYCLSGLSGEL